MNAGKGACKGSGEVEKSTNGISKLQTLLVCEKNTTNWWNRLLSADTALTGASVPQVKYYLCCSHLWFTIFLLRVAPWFLAISAWWGSMMAWHSFGSMFDLQTQLLGKTGWSNHTFVGGGRWGLLPVFVSCWCVGFATFPTCIKMINFGFRLNVPVFLQIAYL